MRTATLLLFSVCAVGAAPDTSLAQASPDSTAVTSTVQRFHEALALRDSTLALGLLAEDAVILESGGFESRTVYRAHHLPADIEFAAAVPSKHSLLQVTVAGDVAWVTSTSEAAGSFHGRQISSVGAELMVLTRGPDGWRIRAVHWSSRRRTAP